MLDLAKTGQDEVELKGCLNDLHPKCEDLVLASLFLADEQKRADVLVFNAFLETIREIPMKVSEPLMGEIRMKWWSEAIEEIIEKRRARYHPIVSAIASIVAREGLDISPLSVLIDAQIPLLDGDLSLDQAVEVCDKGEGIIATLCAKILSEHADHVTLSTILRPYGLARLKAMKALQVQSVSDGDFHEARKLARLSLKTLNPNLLPLVAHAALARDVWRGKMTNPLMKRLKIMGGYVFGFI